MNIRLLKKLRKEASKRYVIKRTTTKFWKYDSIHKSYIYYNPPFSVYDIAEEYYVCHGDSLEKAQERCKETMIKWIESQIFELRRKKMESYPLLSLVNLK